MNIHINAILDLSLSDEFNVSGMNRSFELVNSKVRKPFRLQIDAGFYRPDVFDFEEYTSTGISKNYGANRNQYFHLYDPTGSLSNWNSDLTNFVTCEIRFMWIWTPTKELEIEEYGTEPYEVFILFVYLETPVDNFNELSNFNPPVE